MQKCSFFLIDLPYQASHSVAAHKGESSAGRVELAQPKGSRMALLGTMSLFTILSYLSLLQADFCKELQAENPGLPCLGLDLGFLA